MNYGVEIMNWNSAHKVENNIIRETRHSVAFEGGSGMAVLYNYTDDNWESVQGQPTVRDDNFLSQDLMPSHGAHPHMNLLEGNYASNIWADFVHGSSGYNTLFKNRLTCFRTSHPLISPWSDNCIALDQYNRNYNIIGNVLGWLGVNNAGMSFSQATVFSFAGDVSPTVIKHGNYDYNTKGVANWDGGADHVLANSMYYNAKPSFFGACAWPPFGPEGNPTIKTLPSKDRYDGTGICQAGKTAPAPPKTLRVN